MAHQGAEGGRAELVEVDQEAEEVLIAAEGVEDGALVEEEVSAGAEGPREEVVVGLVEGEVATDVIRMIILFDYTFIFYLLSMGSGVIMTCLTRDSITSMREKLEFL